MHVPAAARLCRSEVLPVVESFSHDCNSEFRIPNYNKKGCPAAAVFLLFTPFSFSGR
jgi:hypothetical protein